MGGVHLLICDVAGRSRVESLYGQSGDVPHRPFSDHQCPPPALVPQLREQPEGKVFERRTLQNITPFPKVPNATISYYSGDNLNSPYKVVHDGMVLKPHQVSRFTRNLSSGGHSGTASSSRI